MTTILRQLRKGSHGVCPVYEVQCGVCSRVYVTAQCRWSVARNRHCAGCKPPGGNARKYWMRPKVFQHKTMRAGFT